MIPSLQKTHRKLALLFLALLCFTQIAIPLYHADALLPVSVDASVDLLPLTLIAGDTKWIAAESTDIGIATKATAVNTAATAGTVAAIAAKQVADTAQSFLERYVIWPAIRVLIFTLIQTLTNQTVAWITGDEGRNSGFVKNLEQNAKTEADARAGEFLNHLSGINLCSVNLKKLVKLQLTTPGFEHLNTQLQCTLTGIVNNVDSFYRDFSQGGWPAFVSIAVNPQNNAFGASMIAQINLEATKTSAKKASEKRIDAGDLFKGVLKRKKAEVCDADVDGNEYCYTQEENTTPGAIVSDALKENLNHVGIDMAIGEATAISNAVDAAISTILNAMIQRLFKESGKLF